MFPMVMEGKDTVIIVPPEFPLKKYDVPVYRRDGHYTMHRIVKVTKKVKSFAEITAPILSVT